MAVLSFGELLLRISPAPDSNGSDKSPFVLYMGGAEANVATALAGWEVPVKYCTALPSNFMSGHVIDYLQLKGIDTAPVLFSDGRIGIYYLERGADLKGQMAYDRENSSFSRLKPGTIDWDKIFQGVTWFNLSAISPALNQNIADVCLEAVKAASAKNIPVSLDLNYRSRLWKYGKSPLEIMPELASYCDLLMGNIWSASDLLGISVDPDIHAKNSRQAYLDHAEATSREIMERFPKCQSAANTFRFDQSEELLYYTALFTAGKQFSSDDFSCRRVVDRSGSGDCFMAGLIYGFYNRHEPQDIVNYAAAAAFGKLQEQGDSTDQDVIKVEKRM